MVSRAVLALILASLALSAPRVMGQQQASLDAVAKPEVMMVHQHLVCNTGYSPALCKKQEAILRGILVRYNAGTMEDWTWVLVRSGDWLQIKERLGLDPASPAFSLLSRRETFLEEAVLGPVPGRSAALIKHWSLSMDDLLLLAVTHEMGHAVCHEGDERKADNYGRLLREGGLLRCR